MEGSDAAWLEEWDSLVIVLWPMDSTHTSAQVSEAKDKLTSNKQFRLWRPLFLHATGADIMKRAANSLQQRAQDDRYLLQLTHLKTSVAGMSDVSAAQIVSTTGALLIPQRQGRKNVRESYTVMSEKSSEEFERVRAAALAQVSAAMDTGTSEIIRQVDAWNKKEFGKVLKAATQLALKVQQNEAVGKDDIDKETGNISALLGKMPKADEVASTADMTKQEADGYELRCNILRTLMSALVGLGAKSFKADDATTIALRELLMAPGEWLSSLPECAPFEDVFEEILFEGIASNMKAKIPIVKMHGFWATVTNKFSDDLRGKSAYLLALADELPDLDAVSASAVLQETTTAADNYVAWHSKPVKVDNESSLELGILCGIPVIAAVMKSSFKLAEVAKGAIKCAVAFPSGEFDNDVMNALKMMRVEISGRPRKGEEVSSLFKEIRECARAFYTEVLNKIATDLAADLTATSASVEQAAASQVLVKFKKDTEEPWPEASMPKLLEAAASENAQLIYTTTKYLEMHRQPVEIFLQTYCDKLDKTTVQTLKGIEYIPDSGRKISGLLTAVQAMGRALKAGETRIALLSRCKSALNHKDMWKHMPAHVQQIINAGETKTASSSASSSISGAAASTAGEAAPGAAEAQTST
jgi:hypothetical protein